MLQTASPPPAVQTDIGADRVPTDIRAILEVAMRDGDTASVERVFGYARSARPDAIAAIDALYASFAAQQRRKQEEADRAARERLARANPLVNWAGQLEFGATWTTGAVSSLGLLGAADLERRGVATLHKVLLRAEIQDTNGARAVERLTASWQPRVLFEDTGYAFGLAQYERDPILGYAHRLSIGIGAGLRFGRTDGFRVTLDGGPAVRRTDRQGATSTSLAGRGAADLNWPFSPRVSLQQKIAAFYEDGRANGLFTSALDTKISSRLTLRLSHDYRFETIGRASVEGSISRASLVVGI
jgi:putative salt-induced outer membrane protein